MEFDYTEKDFNLAYTAIFDRLTSGNVPKERKTAYFLGGQPGAGKSSFYTSLDDAKDNFIVIDGDEFRKSHPLIKNIEKYDLDNYADRTQQFTNRVIEKIISDLSDEGYNLIIEGTLRNPLTTINTCKLLNNKGYDSKLFIISCSAEESWLSTLQRADFLQKINEVPRLVPIDKYDRIVNNLPSSVKEIEDSKVFSSITVLNRKGENIIDSSNSSSKIIENGLKLEEWNKNIEKHAEEYAQKKIELLQRQENIRRGIKFD